MLRRIHDRLGTAGFVIAIVALVAALCGGAYAASGISGREKTEIKKYAKKYSKQFAIPGAQGPAGPQGPAGTAGKEGARGAQGEPGENGQDGEDGACSESVPTCVLPSKATLTGDWSFFAPTGGKADFALISFPLQVGNTDAEKPTPVWIGLPEWLSTGETYDTADCPGTVEEPKANPGFLCIYVKRLTNAGSFARHTPSNASFGGGSTGDVNSGLNLEFKLITTTEEAIGDGSWAVTAS
jgi:hypothetical protein